MKNLIRIFLCCLSWQLLAQTHPAVGTWELTSGDTLQSIKMITPTHWALVTHRLKKDGSKEFVRACAGTYTITRDTYLEKIDLASWNEDLSKIKTNYTYTITGDTFHQKGTLTLSDGTRYDLDEKWQKAKLAGQANPGMGTWNQLTSSGVRATGEKWSHTSATHIRYMIVSPTHYIIIRKKDNQFEDVLAGTYRMEGATFIPAWEYASQLVPEGIKLEVAQRIEAGKLLWDGKMIDKEGTHTWHDVYEKVPGKTSKTASTK